MQIDGTIQALREDLVRFAALGDENTSRAASSTARSLRRASACLPCAESGFSERNITALFYRYSEQYAPNKIRQQGGRLQCAR